MSEITRTYCQRYAISLITLEMVSGVVDAADRVCTLTLEFTPGHVVKFKLLGHSAQLGERVCELHGNGAVVSIDGIPIDNIEDDLESLFKEIEGRLDRIQHEEKVQSITFLGNTFVLNGKTVFSVVADDDGRLTIEMHKGDTRQDAVLLASSLLDGLYDGSVVLK